MSEYNTYKGTLELVSDLATFLKNNNIDQYDEDEFFDKFEYSYIIHKDNVYKVHETDIQYENIYHANILLNKNIQFVIHYYNGGEGFGEALEEALKTIK